MIQKVPWGLGRGSHGVRLVQGRLRKEVEPDMGPRGEQAFGERVKTSCLLHAGHTHGAGRPWFVVILLPMFLLACQAEMKR